MREIERDTEGWEGERKEPESYREREREIRLRKKNE